MNARVGLGGSQAMAWLVSTLRTGVAVSLAYNNARGCNFRSRSQRYPWPPMLGCGNPMVGRGILPTKTVAPGVRS